MTDRDDALNLRTESLAPSPSAEAALAAAPAHMGKEKPTNSRARGDGQ